MSNDLQVIEQRTATFYDDLIPAVRVEESGETAIYIPIRPICEALGVDRRGQQQRVERDEILSEVSRVISITISGGVTPPQGRNMLCLPIEFLNGFLFGINAKRVKENVRPRLLRYQRECYKVLADAWQDGRLSTNNPPLDEMLATGTHAAEAYKMLQAMLRLAHNQLLIEARQDTQQTQLDQHEQRLETLETAISKPSRTISESQASQLSQSVKAVAMALGKQTRRNEYGGVYGELYRRYQITSYKLLPLSKFDEAMSWLSEWLDSLTGETPF